MTGHGGILSSPGTVIVLNGTSSAGKTSLAQALQQALLPTPYVSLGFDLFMSMLPPGSDRRPDSDELLHGTVRAMHRAIRALAESGGNVIVDHILRCPIHPDDRDWVKDLMAVLPAERTYLVKVICSLEELDRRERLRWEIGSGKIGLGRRQYIQIHAGNLYDAEVDTTGRSAEESARIVVDALAAIPPRALRRMRALESPSGA